MAANFVITKEISVNGNKITKFRSSKTGLSVVHVDNEGALPYILPQSMDAQKKNIHGPYRANAENWLAFDTHY